MICEHGRNGRGSPRRDYLPFLVLPLLLASCTVKLVADYDEHIDRTATQLQQDMDRHLTDLEAASESRPVEYAASSGFYRDYAVKLRSMRVRAQGHARNDITLKQLDRIEASLEDLRQLHERQATVGADYARTAREMFNAQWAAVIAWEIAKKRGD